MSAGSKDESGDRSAESFRSALKPASIPVLDNRIYSRDLFATSREILIAHGDETYRLRLTAQNKLILTK